MQPHPSPLPTACPLAFLLESGVEQFSQLARLITWRSSVRIRPPELSLSGSTLGPAVAQLAEYQVKNHAWLGCRFESCRLVSE